MVDFIKKIQAVRFFSSRLFRTALSVSLLVVLIGTSHAASDCPVLDSRHKHLPGKKGNIQNSSGSRSSIVQFQADQTTKNKPGTLVTAYPNPSEESLRKKVSAKSAIILDADTGRTLYAHAIDRAGQPASTIKILTGLIALNTLKEGDWVNVSRRAAEMPRSKVYLRSGKSYKAGDLINSVLLASANDASVALAEKITGSEKAFAKLMTYNAEKLGAKETICKNATGLTARGQQSTVQDLAILFGAAMGNPEFAARMARTKVQTSYGKLLRNHNKALWKVKGTEGGKTGYTQAARQTYVGKFRRPEGEILVAIMGSEAMWDDIDCLVEYGFANKQYQNIAAMQNLNVEEQLNQLRQSLNETSTGLQVLTANNKLSKM